MKFLVYSQIRKDDIGANLGRPEYSYFFVLDQFLPALARIGDIVPVTEPHQEVDSMWAQCSAVGEDCVFICFAPPNKSITGLRCPTVTVFAWEFDRLPDEVWDDDWRNDWTRVLRQQGRAICLSGHSAGVVRKALGSDFAVAAIPVPVFDRFAVSADAAVGRAPVLHARTFDFVGRAYDSRHYAVSATSIENRAPVQKLGVPLWNGASIDLNFQLGHDGGGYLGGFYETEGWGTWSKTENPWILMPQLLHGKFSVRIDAVAYGPNFGRTIAVEIGDCRRELLLDHETPCRTLDFDVATPAALVQFRGLDTTSVPGVSDPRSMGIGLRGLHIERIGAAASVDVTRPDRPRCVLDLDGVVYVSVLNPGDDRKNWVDILTAFCFAFRDVSDATLVLKMTHHSVAAFLGAFHYQLQRIGAVKCRVVLVHGFLDDAQYRQLIDVATFYVNASRCEGLCLPLMEFMSSGVPAVAPCNTAMEDYVTGDSVFIVRSSTEPGVWPHDPRNVFRTLRYRIDWSSLSAAFSQSYDVARGDAERYRRMSRAAISAQKAFCSNDVVEKKLREFFRVPGQS